jgi:hypothetical protein
LIKQHPYVNLALKEKINHDMIARDTNDLDYLVGLSTPLLKLYRLNILTWLSFVDSVWACARQYAEKIIHVCMPRCVYGTMYDPYSVIWVSIGEPIWDTPNIILPVPTNYGHTNMVTASNVAWSAEFAQVYDVTVEQVVHYLDITDNIYTTAATQGHVCWSRPQCKLCHDLYNIHKKVYQVAECLLLLSIDHKFCRDMREREKNLSKCTTIPPVNLEGSMKDNVWVKQYVELFNPNVQV